MASNYKQTQISGSSYVRCNKIDIVNPLGMTPSVRFSEEKVTVLSDRTICEPCGEIIIPFDPARIINIMDTDTGNLTGAAISYAEIYAILFSEYIALANARDSTTVDQNTI